MKTARKVVEEIVSLFVDDWISALAVVAWIAAIFFLHRQAPAVVEGTVLLAGLAIVSLYGAVRQARKIRSGT